MNIVDFAKLAVERGVSAMLSRQEFEAEIAKRAETIRRTGETKEQAFTRFMTETPEGRVLFKAAKLAPVAEVKAAETKSPVRKRGPAHDEIDRLARAHAREKNVSYASAFAKVMVEPENRELAARVLAEERAA